MTFVKRLLSDHRTTVLFTGYQAGGTRGAKMLNRAEKVKIQGEWILIRAHVEVIHGLSGHGVYREIEQWLRQIDAAERLSNLHDAR